MHLVYIDDSFEHPHQIYSAIAVPAHRWRDCFDAIKAWRSGLKQTDSILITREFHATEFTAGRGRLGPQIVGKYRRSRIFLEAMQLLNSLDGVRIFNVCRTSKPQWALERLITRIHKTMETWDSYATLIFDEGKEAEITRLLRKMGVYNPVPVYVAPGQTELKNLAVSRILEDPVFKESDRSYFVQMADFVAYALLRREKPLPAKSAYGYHEMFDILKDVVAREASLSDPMGVIR
jgi:hypothetical protein